jgi:hypothetical protein
MDSQYLKQPVDRAPRLIQSLIGQKLSLDPANLTELERSTGKVTIKGYDSVFRESMTCTYDIAKPLTDLTADRKSKLMTSHLANIKLATDPLLPLIKKELVKAYSTLLDQYRATHKQLQRTAPLVPVPNPNPAAAPFAQFYNSDIPERTVSLKGMAPPPEPPIPRKGVCARLSCRSKPKEEVEKEPTEFLVHDFVFHGDNIGSPFRGMMTQPSLEQQTKEIHFKETPNSAVMGLVEYLYKGAVQPQSDKDAQALYHLSNQFSLDGLKPYCEKGALNLDILDADPSRLATVEQVAKTLEDCETADEMAQVAQQAQDQVKDFKQRYLDPHVQAAMK